MSNGRMVRLARRVRVRFALAWDESRVSGAQVYRSPYSADAGETPFVPSRLAAAAARFPRTTNYPTVESVERRMGAAASSIRLVANTWMPHEAAGILPLVDAATGWGRALPAGERLYCVQPLSNNFVLSSDEVEQIVGLAGRVDFVEETGTPDGGRAIVAGATIRPRACALLLAWPAELVADPARVAAALRALARMPDVVRGAAHVIESPARSDDSWFAGVTRVVSTLIADEHAVLGIRPTAPPPDPGALIGALGRIPGARARLTMQWVERGDDVAAIERVGPGIVCDCSLEIAGDADARAYVGWGAYLPSEFDARVPSFSSRADALVEIARVDGRNIPPRDLRGWTAAVISPERQADRALADLLDAPIAETAARLRSALDLRRRQAYLQALETDRSQVARWHQFHVYNWPAPPPAILRLVSYDAGDLLRADSGLRALDDWCGNTKILTGHAFVSWALSMAADAAGTAARIRESQIAAHGYLASGGRAELTADSEQLIARLPPALGSTLEIGFGYALTARRIAGRATRYVGIDLQTEQARALRETGGHGLVADLQALPLASGSFDTVIADNVLEHASSPLDALRELRRVLTPRGRVYALIPLDAATSEFQIRTHLWKADERSIRRAAGLTGFRIVDLDVLEYATLAIYGCFPASCGRTCLAVLEPVAVAERRVAG